MSSAHIKDTIVFAATLAGAVTLIVSGHWPFGILLLLIL